MNEREKAYEIGKELGSGERTRVNINDVMMAIQHHSDYNQGWIDGRMEKARKGGGIQSIHHPNLEF